MQVVSCLLFVLAGALSSDVVVESPLGRVIGKRDSALHSNVVAESFLGIPYAKAPINERRFAHPEPYGSLGDNFKAQKFGSRCETPTLFNFMYSHDPVGASEDCLYLNVFRPTYTSASSSLPVLAIIHGGGFTIGHSAELWMQGGPMAGLENIIVVTFNYRLGIMGFADMGEVAPGNLGLYDQILALEWIQENIAAFGGDADQVTLLGVSAGSMSVSAHIVSPVSRDNKLFRSAIMDAGVLARGTAIPQEESIRKIKDIATKLHCPSQGVEMVHCLRKLKSTALVDMSFDPKKSSILSFQPTLDGVYLPEDIAKDFLDNVSKYKKVKMMLGYTIDEGSIFVTNSLIPQALPELKTEEECLSWIKRLSNSMKFPLDFGDESVRQDITDVYIKAFQKPLEGASTFLGDGTFVCPINSFVKAYSQHSNNVYVYRFERILQQTYVIDPKIFGVHHFSPFLHFTGGLLCLGDKIEASDRKFFLDSMKLVADFVRSDDPPHLRGVQWPDFSTDKKVLVIDEQPSIDNRLHNEPNCDRVFHFYEAPSTRVKLEL